MKKTEEHSFELVVVGGGMSGICAAMAAARHGVKTALIHARPMLGGNASSEIRIHISSATDGARKPELEETGILYELMLKNKARNPYHNYNLWDMTLFEEVKAQENLTLFLNTVMVDAETEEDRISRIFCFQETTEKHLYFTSPLFVDATGNGTLGYFADAEYRTGSEGKAEFDEPHAPDTPNNDRMGNTILFRAVDLGHPVPFTPPAFAKKLTEEDLRLRVHSDRHKMDYSQAEDPEDYKRVSATSANSSDYGYWWIELMGDGDYILNEKDIWEHRQFEDAVAYGGWGIDLHVKNGLYDLDKLPSQVWNFDGTYTIPYRSYYSKNISNLFMAGRDISCSKMGMASTRIIGTCAIGGQAVGTAAALCKKYNCTPRELMPHITELQQILLKDDVYLPNIVNEDENDLARRAHISAGAEALIDGVSRRCNGKDHSWRGNIGDSVTLRWEEKVTLRQLRLTFDTNFNYAIRITMAPKRQAQQRVGVPPELVKDYTVKFFNADRCVYEKRIENNIQRHNIIDFEPVLCDRAELCFTATNGAETAEVFEIRAY